MSVIEVGLTTMAEKNAAIPNKNTSIPNKEVADLGAFDPEVRNLVLATRGFVFQMFPGITEQVDAKARIIGYGYGPEYTSHGVQHDAD